MKIKTKSSFFFPLKQVFSYDILHYKNTINNHQIYTHRYAWQKKKSRKLTIKKGTKQGKAKREDKIVFYDGNAICIINRF